MINYCKQNFKRFAIYFFIFIIIFLSIQFIMTKDIVSTRVDVTVNQKELYEMQMFYSDLDNNDVFTEESSIKQNVQKTNDYELISFSLPQKVSKSIRVDLGAIKDNNIFINDIEVSSELGKFTVNSINFNELIEKGTVILNNISLNKDGNNISFTTTGEDPFIVIKSIAYAPISTNKPITIPLIISIIAVFFMYKYVYLNDIKSLIFDILKNRKLLISLALNDFKVKYAGSFFGIIWAFAQPVSTILLFWFVFQVGLRSTPVSNVPFALWLSCGLVPWFFFSEAWNGITSCFLEYSYLVKKVVFNINILPFVKILSSLFIHLFFILFLLILFLFQGIYPTLNIFYTFYYMVCMIILASALGFITSSLVVFIRDITPFMGIILQFAMWLTPIMWSIDILPEPILNVIKLNPMYYVVQGYRWCFIGDQMAVPTIKEGIYFWLVTIFIMCLGISLFRRLRVHFADVL